MARKLKAALLAATFFLAMPVAAQTPAPAFPGWVNAIDRAVKGAVRIKNAVDKTRVGDLKDLQDTISEATDQGQDLHVALVGISEAVAAYKIPDPDVRAWPQFPSTAEVFSHYRNGDIEKFAQAVAAWQQALSGMNGRQRDLSEAIAENEKHSAGMRKLAETAGQAGVVFEEAAFAIAVIDFTKVVFGKLDEAAGECQEIADRADQTLTELREQQAALNKQKQEESAFIAEFESALLSAQQLLWEWQLGQRKDEKDPTRQPAPEREVPLAAGDGLPLTFAGIATDGTYSSSYSGSRNGSQLSGTYVGPDSSGRFSGVIDQAGRVRGQYVDRIEDGGERGSFMGTATSNLDRVIGGITCQQNCE